MSVTTLAAAPGGGSSNGKTSAFGAEYRGSNPCPPAARQRGGVRSDARLDSLAGPLEPLIPSTRIAFSPRLSFSRPSLEPTSSPHSSRTRSSR